MSRTLFAVSDVCEPRPTDTLADGLTAWLCAEAAAFGECWLLAHADDGLIWGWVNASFVRTSHEAATGDPNAAAVCPPLRLPTLQTARLFHPDGEVLLWRDDPAGWRARRVRAALPGEPATLGECFDEDQILWGTRGTRLGDTGFTLLEDGAQGLRHVVPPTDPSPLPAARPAPGQHVRLARLRLRHYVAPADDGFVRICLSRLVCLYLRPEGPS